VLTKNPFIEPCLPTLTREPPMGPAWVHEVKFDGYRIQIHKDGKHVALYSKNGNDFLSRFPTLLTAVAALPCVILDAEVTACRDDGSPDFTALLRRRDAPLCLWVFDILAQNETDLREQTLSQRRQKLNKLMVRTRSQVIRRRRSSSMQPVCCGRVPSGRWKASSRSGSICPIAPDPLSTGSRPSVQPGARSTTRATSSFRSGDECRK
jgi:ATP-dependent DNA ligase